MGQSFVRGVPAGYVPVVSSQGAAVGRLAIDPQPPGYTGRPAVSQMLGFMARKAHVAEFLTASGTRNTHEPYTLMRIKP